MKPVKKIIRIVKHVPTGAKIPVVVNDSTKVKEGDVAIDVQEYMHNRKAFTIHMLCNRWDKTASDVLEILNRYQVPGHLRQPDIDALPEGMKPIDVALFFEEYIYALERKSKLPHSKLKAKKLKETVFH